MTLHQCPHCRTPLPRLEEDPFRDRPTCPGCGAALKPDANASAWRRREARRSAPWQQPGPDATAMELPPPVLSPEALTDPLAIDETLSSPGQCAPERSGHGAPLADAPPDALGASGIFGPDDTSIDVMDATASMMDLLPASSVMDEEAALRLADPWEHDTWFDPNAADPVASRAADLAAPGRDAASHAPGHTTDRAPRRTAGRAADRTAPGPPRGAGASDVRPDRPAPTHPQGAGASPEPTAEDSPLELAPLIPPPRSAPLPPQRTTARPGTASFDDRSLALAAEDLPRSGGRVAEVGLKPLPIPESPRRDDPPPERRPISRVGVAALVILTLGILGAVGWVMDRDGALSTSAAALVEDLSREADTLAEETQKEARAVQQEIDAQPRERGLYVERVHTRADGSQVRVWVRREDAQADPNAGVAAPRPPKRAQPPAPLPERTPAPDFTVNTIDGQRVSLEALRGQVVVLNFYTNTCRHCRASIPALEREHRKGRVALYGVVMASGPAREAADASRQQGVAWPIVAGTPALGDLYDASAFPTTVVIDRKGLIAARLVGRLTPQRLDAAVRAASK